MPLGVFSPAFSKKPSEQVIRKQNLALPPVQDIINVWDYRFRKASGTTLKDKSSSESLLQGQFLAFKRPDMIYYTTSPQENPLKAPKLPDSYFNIARVKTLSASISVPAKQHIIQETVCRENVQILPPSHTGMRLEPLTSGDNFTQKLLSQKARSLFVTNKCSQIPLMQSEVAEEERGSDWQGARLQDFWQVW